MPPLFTKTSAFCDQNFDHLPQHVRDPNRRRYFKDWWYIFLGDLQLASRCALQFGDLQRGKPIAKLVIENYTQVALSIGDRLFVRAARFVLDQRSLLQKTKITVRSRSACLEIGLAHLLCRNRQMNTQPFGLDSKMICNRPQIWHRLGIRNIYDQPVGHNRAAICYLEITVCDRFVVHLKVDNAVLVLH